MQPHHTLRHTLLIGLACVCFAQAAEPNLSDLLRKHDLAAGTERMLAVQSIIEVQLISDGRNTHIQTAYFKKPGKLRVESLGERGRVIRGTDGRTCWCVVQRSHGPFQKADLSKSDEEELRAAALTAPFDDLQTARVLKAEIELQSNSLAADGHLFLLVSEKSKLPYRLKIDPATGMVTGRYWTAKGQLFQRLYTSPTNIDGIVSHTQERTLSDGEEVGRMQLCSVRYDTEIDDSVFEPPLATDAGTLPQGLKPTGSSTLAEK